MTYVHITPEMNIGIRISDAEFSENKVTNKGAAKKMVA
jgi:hypothetical protein